jgi:hypothetical protein
MYMYYDENQDVVRRYVTKELRKLGGDLNPALLLGAAGLCVCVCVCLRACVCVRALACVRAHAHILVRKFYDRM